MARLTPIELDDAADNAFQTAGNPKIMASNLRDYAKLQNKNTVPAFGYAFLVGSVPANRFTQTFTNSSIDTVKFLNNPDWGGNVNIGSGIDSVPFDGITEITADLVNNRQTVSANGFYAVDASYHAESSNNDRQLIMDLCKISANGLVRTPYAFDMYNNGRTGNKTNSVAFPSIAVDLLAGESIELCGTMAPGEADTVFTFFKCFTEIRLIQLID